MSRPCRSPHSFGLTPIGGHYQHRLLFERSYKKVQKKSYNFQSNFSDVIPTTCTQLHLSATNYNIAVSSLFNSFRQSEVKKDLRHIACRLVCSYALAKIIIIYFAACCKFLEA